MTMQSLRRRLVMGGLIFTLSLAASAQDSLRATIEEQGKKFAGELKKGDAVAIANMYTADATALPPNGEMAHGRAAIQKLWEGAISDGLRNLSFDVMEVEKKGDVLYEVGKYTVKDDSGGESDRGKYIVIWKKEGGSWKLHRDIWNSSMPPAAAAK